MRCNLTHGGYSFRFPCVSLLWCRSIAWRGLWRIMWAPVQILRGLQLRISKSGCKTTILLCYRQKMRPKKVILKSSFMGNSIHKLIQSGVLDWIRYFFQRGKNNFLCLIFTPDQILKRRRRVSHALKAATFTSSQKGCVLLCNNEQLNDLFWWEFLSCPNIFKL